MTTTVSLHTTTDALHAMHKALEVHDRAATIKVDREALERLLMDHANMYSALRGSTSFKLEEPKRERVRTT